MHNTNEHHDENSQEEPQTNAHKPVNKTTTTTLHRWINATRKIHERSLYTTQVARVPFELQRLAEFRSFFLDSLGLYDKELSEDDFISAFGDAMPGRHFSREELAAWFRDIDADCGGTVSYDEFSSFVLKSAEFEKELSRAMDRARDFVPDISYPATSFHKQQVTGLLPIGTPKFLGIPESGAAGTSGIFSLITTAHDGVVRLWRKSTFDSTESSGQAATEPYVTAALSNFTTSEKKDAGSHGFIKATPIVDVTVAGNAADGAFFTLGADRSVNIWQARSQRLTLRYKGYPQAASNFIRATLGTDRGVFSGEPQDGVPLVRLLDMDDFPASLAVGRPGVMRQGGDNSNNDNDDGLTFHGDEVFFFGMQNGDVMTYKTERHMLRALRQPLKIFSTVHQDRVHKLAFSQQFGGLVSASWDGTMRITDVETNRTRFGFDCVNRHFTLLGEQLTNGYFAHTTIGFGSGVDDVDLGEARHLQPVTDFSMSEHQHLIATAAGEHQVLLWSPATTAHPIGLLRSPKSKIIAVTLACEHQMAMTLDQVGVVRCWDLRTNTQRQFMHIEEHEGIPQEFSEPPRRICYEPRTGSLVVANRVPTTFTLRRKIAASVVHNDQPVGMLVLDSASGGGWVVTCDSTDVACWSAKTGLRRLVFVPFAGASDRKPGGNAGEKHQIQQQQRHFAGRRGDKQRQEAERSGVAALAGISSTSNPASSSASAAEAMMGSEQARESLARHSIVAMALDRYERRLFVVAKSGLVRVVNVRTGMLIGELRPRFFRENESGDVLAVQPLSSGDKSSRVVCVATSTELHFVWDAFDDRFRGASFQFKKHRVLRCKENQLPRIVFVARGCDPDDKTFVPWLVCGVEDGRMLLVNSMSATVLMTLRGAAGGVTTRGLGAPAIPLRRDATVGTKVYSVSDGQQQQGDEDEDIAGRNAVATLLATRDGPKMHRLRAGSAAGKRGGGKQSNSANDNSNGSDSLANPRIEDVAILRNVDALVLCFEGCLLLEVWNLRFHFHVVSRNTWPLTFPKALLQQQSQPSFTAVASDARNELLFAGDIFGCIYCFDIRDLDTSISSAHWMSSSSSSAPALQNQQRQQQASMSSLPSYLSSAHSFESQRQHDSIRLVKVFRAHTDAILRLSVSDSAMRIVSLGADLAVHSHTVLGRHDGCFGPQERFKEAQRGSAKDPLIIEITLTDEERSEVPIVHHHTLLSQTASGATASSSTVHQQHNQQNARSSPSASRVINFSSELQEAAAAVTTAKKAVNSPLLAATRPQLPALRNDDDEDDEDPHRDAGFFVTATRIAQSRGSSNNRHATASPSSALALVNHQHPLRIPPGGLGFGNPDAWKRRAATPSPVPTTTHSSSIGSVNNNFALSLSHVEWRASPIADLRRRHQQQQQQKAQLPPVLRTHDGLKKHLEANHSVIMNRAAASSLSESGAGTGQQQQNSSNNSSESSLQVVDPRAALRIPIEELSFWKDSKALPVQRSKVHLALLKNNKRMG